MGYPHVCKVVWAKERLHRYLKYRMPRLHTFTIGTGQKKKKMKDSGVEKSFKGRNPWAGLVCPILLF